MQSIRQKGKHMEDNARRDAHYKQKRKRLLGGPFLITPLENIVKVLAANLENTHRPIRKLLVGMRRCQLNRFELNVGLLGRIVQRSFDLRKA